MAQRGVGVFGGVFGGGVGGVVGARGSTWWWSSSTSAPEGSKKNLSERKWPRTSYEKSTDVIRSKQRPRAPYLPFLISMAFRSDGVLYLTREMKEIDLGVDSSEVSNGTRTNT
jgi:hypothetical protein